VKIAAFGVSDYTFPIPVGEVKMEFLLAGFGGWVVAYIINYLSDVLPFTRQFTRPECRQCNSAFSIKGYIFMQPCAGCGRRRTVRAWCVQIGMALASMWMWMSPPARLGFWLGVALLAFFALVAVIDLEHRLILHPVSWIGAGMGLLVGILQKGIWITLLGGLAGYGIMLALFFLGIAFNRLMAKMRHQEVDDALGFGDVNLAGIIGLLLGWPEIVGGLLIAILAGGLTSGLVILVTAILRKYKAMTAIPYAPFLILGAMIFLYIPKQ
jgi:leader peptidase (prepilin peptidase)/N-methyltransferase